MLGLPYEIELPMTISEGVDLTAIEELLTQIAEKIDGMLYALTMLNALTAFAIALLLVIIFTNVWGRH